MITPTFSFFLIFFYNLLYKTGPIFLLLALVFGIIGLPIPDEILLIGAGYLVAHQKLNLFATIVCAVLGSCIGITISYLLGRLMGKWIVHKYGKTLKITSEKMQLVRSWYARIGKWVLIFGYYIPLFRHLVGFVAGGTKLKYSQFALFAYIGATLWSLTFLSIGFFFNRWFVDTFGK